MEYYQPGDVIFTGRDFAHVIYEKYKKEYCDYCLRNVQAKLCSKCHYVGYCNKQCQVTAWPQHQFECRIIVKHYQSLFANDDIFLLFLRVIRKLKSKDIEEYYETFGSRKVTFSDLKNGFTLYGKDTDVQNAVQFYTSGLACGFLAHLKEEFAMQLDVIRHICQKVYFNRAPLNNDKEFGLYLCLGRWFFQRSCVPNAVAIPTFNQTFEIKATQKIRKDGSEKILLTFVNIVDSFCDICNPENVMIHFNEECCACLPGTSWSEIIDSDLANYVVIPRSLRIVNRLIDHKGEIPSEYRKEVDECLKLQRNVLGDKHMYRLKFLVWKVILDHHELFTVKRMERSLIHVIRTMFGEQSYELFKIYSHLTEIYANFNKMKIAKSYKCKRDELGSLYHKMPLNFPIDARFEETETAGS